MLRSTLAPRRLAAGGLIVFALSAPLCAGLASSAQAATVSAVGRAPAIERSSTPLDATAVAIGGILMVGGVAGLVVGLTRSRRLAGVNRGHHGHARDRSYWAGLRSDPFAGTAFDAGPAEIDWPSMLGGRDRRRTRDRSADVGLSLFEQPPPSRYDDVFENRAPEASLRNDSGYDADIWREPAIPHSGSAHPDHTGTDEYRVADISGHGRHAGRAIDGWVPGDSALSDSKPGSSLSGDWVPGDSAADDWRPDAPSDWRPDAPSDWRADTSSGRRPGSASDQPASATGTVAEAESRASAIWEEACDHAAAVRDGAANDATEARLAAQQEAAEILRHARTQADALLAAAEEEVAQARATVGTMTADLGRVAAYVAEQLSQPTIPPTRPKAPPTGPLTGTRYAAPAAPPDADGYAGSGDQAGRRASAPPRRQGTQSPPEEQRHTRAKTKKTPARQVLAVRWAAAGVAALLLFGLVTVGAEVALHGFGFFVCRSTGSGETGPHGPAENQCPGQADAPKPAPSHIALSARGKTVHTK